METTWREGPPTKPGIYALEWRAESGFSNTRVVYWNGVHARDLATDEAYRQDNISRHCPLTVSDPPPLPKPLPPRPAALEPFLVWNEQTNEQRWAHRVSADGRCFMYSPNNEQVERYETFSGWHRVETSKPPLPVELTGLYDSFKMSHSRATFYAGDNRLKFIDYCEKHFDCGDGK